MAERTDYYFEVYNDVEGNYRWRFYAPNGRVMADSGQGYTEKSSCTEAIHTICREAKDGVSIDDAT